MGSLAVAVLALLITAAAAVGLWVRVARMLTAVSCTGHAVKLTNVSRLEARAHADAQRLLVVLQLVG